MPDTVSHTPFVGQRIKLHGHKGSIKFIGEVDGTSGVWLGIEWDDPKRGKHSGEKDGRKYFDCKIPGSGSFIRPSSSINYGQSFLSALVSKYVELPQDTSGSGKETVILGSSNGTIEVEAVGLNKVRGKLARLEDLREISLDSEDVAYADPIGKINSTCPNIRNLDLSNSLLPSWDMVALIAVELPALRELSLNSNRFSTVYDTRPLESAFLALEELRINHIMTTWSDFLAIIHAFPKLRYLELGYNALKRLDTNTAPPNGLIPDPRIEILNLDCNDLEDWSNLMIAISSFPLLNRLIITANQINEIPIHVPPSVRQTSNIKYLGLQDNFISNWTDIDALNCWLPNLRTLNISGNPIVIRSSDFRQQAIARLPHLESLNGSSISTKERIDSEIYYVSHSVQAAESDSDKNLAKQSPRWRELCIKHGFSDDDRILKNTSSTLGDRLINIKIHYLPSGNKSADVLRLSSVSAKALVAQLPPPTELRVLPTMSLKLLRLKILKALRLPFDRKASNVENMDTWLIMNDDKLTKLDMDQENHDLSWWGIQSGSEIVVTLGT